MTMHNFCYVSTGDLNLCAVLFCLTHPPNRLVVVWICICLLISDVDNLSDAYWTRKDVPKLYDKLENQFNTYVWLIFFMKS